MRQIRLGSLVNVSTHTGLKEMVVDVVVVVDAVVELMAMANVEEVAMVVMVE